MLCHCNSQKPFSNCCESILTGKSLATTAEQLMRSRYSAFVIGDINYLMISHHPTTRPIKERNEILRWTKSVRWMGLQIVTKKAGEEKDTEGWVEFKAMYSQDGLLECIHENSYFEKQLGIWYYKSGTHK